MYGVWIHAFHQMKACFRVVNMDSIVLMYTKVSPSSSPPPEFYYVYWQQTAGQCFLIFCYNNLLTHEDFLQDNKVSMFIQ